MSSAPPYFTYLTGFQSENGFVRERAALTESLLEEHGLTEGPDRETELLLILELDKRVNDLEQAIRNLTERSDTK